MPKHSCSKKDCPNSFVPHLWGKRWASADGWFMQRNGQAWCPDHVPEWVAGWRSDET